MLVGMPVGMVVMALHTLDTLSHRKKASRAVVPGGMVAILLPAHMLGGAVPRILAAILDNIGGEVGKVR